MVNLQGKKTKRERVRSVVTNYPCSVHWASYLFSLSHIFPLSLPPSANCTIIHQRLSLKVSPHPHPCLSSLYTTLPSDLHLTKHILYFSPFSVESVQMEIKLSLVEAMVNPGLLTCAREALATLLTYALFQVPFGLLTNNKTKPKGDYHRESQSKLVDAEAGDGDEGNNNDDDGDGGFGEGEEELSSEEGEGYGKNPTSNNGNSKKGTGEGAGGAGEENGEDDEEEDGDDHNEDDDNDDDDDNNNEEDNEDEGGDEEEEEILEEEKPEEDEEDEEEEALQPPKKRKK
uniref:Nucleolin n=1 Tax=Vitis vinifera TaxID=29760 RepID=F6H0P2_VITVI